MKKVDWYESFIKSLKYITIFGLCCVVISVVVPNGSSDFSQCLSAISTILSLVLSFISIVYTYISSEKTATTLDNIETQNKILVEKIKSELNKRNVNDSNLESFMLDDKEEE